MTPLAPGVWLARGGTHNSFVIEMADHLVIFEPPLFEGRSEGVIAAAKQCAPGKPIRHIVLSHFHDDHMGGVRTYAAEGGLSSSIQAPAITSARSLISGVQLNQIDWKWRAVAAGRARLPLCSSRTRLR